ncbi:CotH kinase family protein [Enhygromyxa salina]|uniref:CotH protein n=1 Tax=Enhygromyxa salina TaxID=215803 RepID=A0A2S9YVE4_9BACT|nr:CotH kinase family protein [Enhygromyxa salina]PRQ09075.1 CotH protein [Enhygromyxa salina]
MPLPSSPATEIRRAWAVTAALCGVLGCGDPPPQFDNGPATNSDELFSIDRLPRFDLTLDPDSWAALEAEPKAWVPGSFEYDGVVYDNVGIRLKGNHSFRPIDDKPAFKIKFNKYIPGGRFLQLEGLTLNNMVVDSSMLREWIGYRVFRAIGVPAPRVGYAQVWVNGELYGLYLDIEPYDDEFLERVYADPSGNLYESDKNADLDEPLDSWDQDEGEDLSRDDLLAFSQLALLDTNEVFYADAGGVDLPRFLAFMAGETILGHFDGHIGGHNFFVYHEPTLDQWSYQPWSLDQALVRKVTPFEHNGYLGYKCLRDSQCLVDYLQASQLALAQFQTVDIRAEVERAIALTDEAMHADPRRPYSAKSVESGRKRSLDFITARAAELAPQLDCLVDGKEPDRDGDGYGPCFQDCDEDDAAINPDAEELCDGIDNNCSGYADDVPACECPMVESEGRNFYLCYNSITWLAARDFCVAQGHVLARFDSATQMAKVADAAQSVHSSYWAFGLNDRDVEAEYRWLDGSAPTFTAWASGEPSHQLGWFDCIFINDGVWSERNCIEQAPFICSDE